MSWIRRVLDHFRGRDIAKEAHTAETLERADHLLDNIDSVRTTIVPKNHRALAELRRLEGNRGRR